MIGPIQAPVQVTMQAQAQQPPPQLPFMLSPGRDNTILDYNEVTATRLYYKAFAPLDKKFNSTREQFLSFLSSVNKRSRSFGWVLIITIAAGPGDCNLLDYGQIKMGQVRTHAITYVATQTRDTHNGNALPIPAWVSHNGIQDQESPS